MNKDSRTFSIRIHTKHYIFGQIQYYGDRFNYRYNHYLFFTTKHYRKRKLIQLSLYKYTHWSKNKNKLYQLKPWKDLQIGLLYLSCIIIYNIILYYHGTDNAVRNRIGRAS